MLGRTLIALAIVSVVLGAIAWWMRPQEPGQVAASVDDQGRRITEGPVELLPIEPIDPDLPPMPPMQGVTEGSPLLQARAHEAESGVGATENGNDEINPALVHRPEVETSHERAKRAQEVVRRNARALAVTERLLRDLEQKVAEVRDTGDVERAASLEETGRRLRTRRDALHRWLEEARP